MGSCFSKNRPVTTCIICFNKANTVLYPCGHYCLCQECADILSRQETSGPHYFHLDYHDRGGMRCPICRRRGLPALVYQNTDELC